MRLVLRTLAALTLVAALSAGYLAFATQPLDWRQSFDGEGCCVDITHAGGLLDGAPYTNSLEALEANRLAGRRIFEIDLSLTADGHVVLAHDWDAYGGAAPTRAAFLADGALTRLDFPAFVAWVRDGCADCRVVTDAKFEFAAFRAAYLDTVPPGLRPRFVIQTYDFAAARQLAAEAPDQPQILTTYLLDDLADDDLASLAPLPSVIAVTMPMDRLPFAASRARAMTGKPVFTHGYPWMLRSELILKLARAFGATGFYKD